MKKVRGDVKRRNFVKGIMPQQEDSLIFEKINLEDLDDE